MASGKILNIDRRYIFIQTFELFPVSKALVFRRFKNRWGYIVQLVPHKFPYGWFVMVHGGKTPLRIDQLTGNVSFEDADENLDVATWTGKAFSVGKFFPATQKSKENTQQKNIYCKKTRNSQIIGIPQVRPFTPYREVFLFFREESCITFWVRLFFGVGVPSQFFGDSLIDPISWVKISVWNCDLFFCGLLFRCWLQN